VDDRFDPTPVASQQGEAVAGRLTSRAGEHDYESHAVGLDRNELGAMLALT